MQRNTKARLRHSLLFTSLRSLCKEICLSRTMKKPECCINRKFQCRKYWIINPYKLKRQYIPNTKVRPREVRFKRVSQ